MRQRILLGLLLLGGCRHAAPPPNGTSSYRVVEPPPERTPPPHAAPEATERANRTQFREAVLQQPAALPVYPPAALQARAGQATVGIHFTVGVDGRVASIRSSVLVFTTPGPFANTFRDAVEAAVRQWRFLPARVEQIETATENGFSYNRIISSEACETELDFAFTFQADGSVAAGK